MRPIESYVFAHSKAGIGEERDDSLVTDLEIGGEGAGETGIVDLLNLIGSG